MTAKITKKTLEAHPLYSDSDFEYFTNKGYSYEEIFTFWNRDWSQGTREPLIHKAAPDLVSYLNE